MKEQSRSLILCSMIVCGLLAIVPQVRVAYDQWRQQRETLQRQQYEQRKLWLVGVWARDSKHDDVISPDWTYEDIYPSNKRKDFKQYARSKEFQKRYRAVHRSKQPHLIFYSDGLLTHFAGIMPYWDKVRDQWRLPDYNFRTADATKRPPTAIYRIVGTDGDVLEIEVDYLFKPETVPEEFRDTLHWTWRVRVSRDVLEMQSTIRDQKPWGEWTTWHRLPAAVGESPRRNKKLPTTIHQP